MYYILLLLYFVLRIIYIKYILCVREVIVYWFQTQMFGLSRSDVYFSVFEYILQNPLYVTESRKTLPGTTFDGAIIMLKCDAIVN